MAAANECIPYYDVGEDVTATAEAAVTGCRFVSISDPWEGPPRAGLSTTTEGSNVRMSHAPAGTRADGVASYDAAAGKKFYCIRGNKVCPVQAGAAIANGAEVEVGTNGQAITLASGKAVGKAWDDIASGEIGPIALY